MLTNDIVTLTLAFSTKNQQTPGNCQRVLVYTQYTFFWIMYWPIL